jgi:hypothetical protein
VLPGVGEVTLEYYCIRAAWNNLGSMPSEAAKVAYVGLVCKLQPNFTPIPGKGSGGASRGGPMGPVFSCMAADDVAPSELEANLGPVSPLSTPLSVLRWV